MKKFELTTDSIEESGTTLYRIKALIDFGDVKAGSLGGYVEKEENLSQANTAWVYGNACVYGNAWVSGNACVYGNARVSGNAWVYGNACVSDYACVSGNACVYGNARVSDNADYILLSGFGSHNRSTTIFKEKSGNICVSCGCFSGTLQEFESKVKETHGNNKFAREYLALVEAAKIHFEV